MSPDSPMFMAGLMTVYAWSGLLADYHNRYDFSELDLVFGVGALICICIAFIVKSLMKD